MTQTSTTVRASAAYGPLLAAFRDAEARGLDIEAAFPRLVAGRSLADAVDVAAVLHGRVERWTQAAGGRNRRADNLIAGLIPRVQRVSDPELAQALTERDQAMEGRARSLADQAVESGESWVQRLGTPPASPARRERWIREVSTIAAYRDRWHISGPEPSWQAGQHDQYRTDESAPAGTGRGRPCHRSQSCRDQPVSNHS